MRTKILTGAMLALCSALLASACIIDVSTGWGWCGGSDCYADQCCAPTCGGVDSWDMCVDGAVPCPLVYAPVCGCDGVTYGNACEAHAMCVAIDFIGECAPILHAH
jgi:hypothetical protein